jgi:transcription elongation factor Elf1
MMYENCQVCEEQRGSWTTIKSNGIVFCEVCWLCEGTHTMKIAQRIREKIRNDE